MPDSCARVDGFILPEREGSAVGVGLYTLGEAARLTSFGQQRGRRWFFGADPVLVPQFPSTEGGRFIGFLNLVEMALIRELLRAGVTWPAVRTAIARARIELADDHPFATRRLHSDGRGIFLETARKTGDSRLLGLVDGNFAMLDVLQASFVRTVTFAGDRPILWRPDAEAPRVILDPARSFGRPIDEATGVPTAALAASLQAEGGDVGRVAAWWKVPADAVQQAAAFEVRHAAPLAA